MSKLNLADLAKNTKTVLSKHAPGILIGFGIAGWAGATVLAVKATPKALALIEERELELSNQYHEDVTLTPVEVVKTCWKCYVPAALAGLSATACLIGAGNVSARRNAALTAAYKLSETALDEYKHAVVETIGEKKEQAVRAKMAENSVKNNPARDEEIIPTSKGNALCYDATFGRYFRSSKVVIDAAMVEINRRIVAGEMYASLNDFYDELELPHIDIGDYLGWNLDDGNIEILDDYDGAHNGEPTFVFRYSVIPKYDFYKFV